MAHFDLIKEIKNLCFLIFAFFFTGGKESRVSMSVPKYEKWSYIDQGIRRFYTRKVSELDEKNDVWNLGSFWSFQGKSGAFFFWNSWDKVSKWFLCVFQTMKKCSYWCFLKKKKKYGAANNQVFSKWSNTTI